MVSVMDRVNSSRQNYSVERLVRVGYYKLEQTIGKGNYAVVKLATHVVTNTKVRFCLITSTFKNNITVLYFKQDFKKYLFEQS